MSRSYYNDEYLKYVKDKNLRELLRDPAKSVICKGKRFVVEDDVYNDHICDSIVENKEVADDPYPYIEELYYSLKRFTDENGLCLMDECSITDFIEFLG